jgi:multiple sugar transport system permease protein
MKYQSIEQPRERKPFLGLLHKQRTGLLLIMPWLLGLILFKIIPIIGSLGISFTDFHLLRPEETSFIGLANYVTLFEDVTAWYIMFITLEMAIATVPLQVVAAILLAALLNSPRLKNRMLLRTLFFLPSIIPSVAIFFMWRGFVDPNTGWLNKFFLEPLGLNGFGGLYSDGAVAFLFGINSLWAIGPGVLIILAALKNLPDEIHESARVDGAGPLERFIFITLPLISPAIFFSLIINLISVFGGVILLDRGNNFSGGSSPYDGYIGSVMFSDFQLGYASSLAWAFFVVVMLVIVILFSTSRKWVYYPDSED